VYRDLSVAVVIPAHNEEKLITQTLVAVPDFVDTVIVVDDASTDHTRARALGAAGGRVRVLAHAENRGVGAAIVTGYRATLESGADIVAVMDGDGQMDPRDLVGLVEPIAAGRADFAKGNRLAGLRARGPMPTTRLVGNLVLSAATRLATGYRRGLDAQCGYTALRSAALARIRLDELYPRYGFPNDLFIRALEAGLRVESVPVRAVYGSEVSGIRPQVAVPRIFGLLARAACRRLVPTSGGAFRNPAEVTEKP
jgi:glycosyltransferase involved in cell wall biosynthesis